MAIRRHDGDSEADRQPVIVSVAVMCLIALTQPVFAQTAIAESPTNKRLWAGIGSHYSAYKVNAAGVFDNQVQIAFTVVNDGIMAADPELNASQLLVNGTVIDRWPNQIAFGIGPAKNRDSIPPGDLTMINMDLTSYFPKPGLYKVKWKGKAFQSNELILRVLKEKP